IVHPGSGNLDKYDLILVPALYAASDELLERLNSFVRDGGHVVYTFKSGFTNENVKVRTTHQPGAIDEACGIRYSMFVEPKSVSFKGDPFEVGPADNKVNTWMELLTPTTAEVVASYDHPHWGAYAAITKNRYGEGAATYIGCLPSAAVMHKVLEKAVKDAGLWGKDQDIHYPLIVKTGVNDQGKTVRYYFNYADCTETLKYPHAEGKELLSGQEVKQGAAWELTRWGIAIIEET
ncbi:beta-galactosidase, partial [Paenibacillus sp. TAF58]